jgi:hypothetical protein
LDGRNVRDENEIWDEREVRMRQRVVSTLHSLEMIPGDLVYEIFLF